ncbi:VirB3 family type IV secretion system protein [Acidithiobacillus sp. YTS05]|nr:VirB3 family type IV secretion system protein [Acidithiobacillus sp. YTS05]
MGGTRQVRLYQSLVRPHLLMGAERQATFYNATFAIFVYFFTLSIPGALVAVALFAAVQVILQQLAKRDAQMIALISRSRKYQTVYADGATLDAEYRDIPQSHKPSPVGRVLSFFLRSGAKAHAEHQGTS